MDPRQLLQSLYHSAKDIRGCFKETLTGSYTKYRKISICTSDFMKQPFLSVRLLKLVIRGVKGRRKSATVGKLSNKSKWNIFIFLHYRNNLHLHRNFTFLNKSLPLNWPFSSSWKLWNHILMISNSVSWLYLSVSMCGGKHCTNFSRYWKFSHMPVNEKMKTDKMKEFFRHCIFNLFTYG